MLYKIVGACRTQNLKTAEKTALEYALLENSAEDEFFEAYRRGRKIDNQNNLYLRNC
jgi:hypothetical protein